MLVVLKVAMCISKNALQNLEEYIEIQLDCIYL